MTLPNIPAGWVLVPVEPNEGMKQAGQRALDKYVSARDCYDAMLNAAPKAPDPSSVHQVAPSIQPLPLEAASPQGSATAGAQATAEEAELLREADDLIHAAIWAAGKLNSEMVLRRSMPRWAELEALVEKREAMRDWRSRRSAHLDAAAQRPIAAPGPDEKNEGLGEPTALRAALEELVALKDLKELAAREYSGLYENSTDYAHARFKHAERIADYERRKPIAWTAARAALALQQEPKP